MVQHHPYPALPAHPMPRARVPAVPRSAARHRIDWQFLTVLILAPVTMLIAVAADIPTASKWFVIALVSSVLAVVVAAEHRIRRGMSERSK